MQKNKNSNKKTPFSIYWVYAILGIGLIAYQYYYSTNSKIPLKTMAQFETLADSGYVENVAIVINKLRVDIRLS
ncbi:MAG TPA: peptidase M41, partial [Taishania sp.]|nr:peptidase M41 [Taishania sp.]